MQSACQVLRDGTPLVAGDILMFLTGQAEIEKAVAKLNEEVAALPSDACMDLLVLPIYAAMPPELQVRWLVRKPFISRSSSCESSHILTNFERG